MDNVIVAVTMVIIVGLVLRSEYKWKKWLKTPNGKRWQSREDAGYNR